MALKIFLSSTLRKHVPGYDPLKGLEVEIEGDVTVAEVCKKMKIPTNNIKVAFVARHFLPFALLSIMCPVSLLLIHKPIR